MKKQNNIQSVKYYVDEEKESKQVIAMIHLANELAESNRLKRIELRAIQKAQKIHAKELGIDDYSL